MVAFASVLAVFTTLVTISRPIVANPSEEISQLLTRQTNFDPSMIPEQCRSQCTSLVDTVTSGKCLDLDCLCSSDVSKAMSSCLRCGISSIGATTAQSHYDNYANVCKTGGKSVPSFTASDSGSSGSSSASRVRVASVGLVGALGVGLLFAI